MTENLQSCPFCGGKPKFAKSGAYAWVFCSNCGATQDSCKTKKEAVDNWNARSTDEVKREPSSYSCRACKSGTDEEIERLKTENARLREALAFYAELDGNGIQLYGDMDDKALEFVDGESQPFGKIARDALLNFIVPDGSRVELSKLKKAMEGIGDGEGKFILPLLIKKGDEK